MTELSGGLRNRVPYREPPLQGWHSNEVPELFAVVVPNMLGESPAVLQAALEDIKPLVQQNRLAGSQQLERG